MLKININLERAKYLVEKQFPNAYVKTSSEYSDKYVFSLASNEDDAILMMNPISVSKKDGALGLFIPVYSGETPIPGTFKVY